MGSGAAQFRRVMWCVAGLAAAWCARDASGSLIVDGQDLRFAIIRICSVEEAAARSGLIVRGVLLPSPNTPGITTTRWGREYKLQVEEVLYGTAGRECSVWLPFTQESSRPRAGDEVLAFSGQLLIVLSREPEALTMKLERLTEREQILKAARSAAKEFAGRLPVSRDYRDTNWRSRWTEVYIPSSRRLRSRPGAYKLEVPTGPRLESEAQKWIRSDDAEVRLAGVRALRDYRFAENAVALQSLLADTATVEERDGPYCNFDLTWSGTSLFASTAPAQRKWERRNAYTIRVEAYDVLCRWEINVPKPDFGLRWTYYAAPHHARSVLISLIAVVLITAMFGATVALRRRRRLGLAHPGRLRTALRGGIAPVYLLLAVALGLLWLRARAHVDELMLRIGNNHHELASYGPRFQYMLVHGWDEPRELLYGAFDRSKSEDYWSADALAPTWQRGKIGFFIAKGSIFDPNGTTHAYHVVRVPYWPIILLLLIPPANEIRIIWKLHRRRRRGLCMNCGYDLRATPERCPECGWRVRSAAGRVEKRLESLGQR